MTDRMLVLPCIDTHSGQDKTRQDRTGQDKTDKTLPCIDTHAEQQ